MLRVKVITRNINLSWSGSADFQTVVKLPQTSRLLSGYHRLPYRYQRLWTSRLPTLSFETHDSPSMLHLTFLQPGSDKTLHADVSVYGLDVKLWERMQMEGCEADGLGKERQSEAGHQHCGSWSTGPRGQARPRTPDCALILTSATSGS